MKKTTPIIATLALAGATVLTGCGVGQASVADEDAIQAATPVPVEVANPFRADIFATYNATATITSDADAPVVARIPGEIVELLVEEGDVVVEGQVLALGRESTIECQDAADVRVLSGHDAGTTRCADGIRAAGILEHHSLSRQFVERRRRIEISQPRLVASHRLPGVIIRHDEQDVRLVGRGGRLQGKYERQ